MSIEPAQPVTPKVHLFETSWFRLIFAAIAVLVLGAFFYFDAADDFITKVVVALAVGFIASCMTGWFIYESGGARAAGGIAVAMFVLAYEDIGVRVSGRDANAAPTVSLSKRQVQYQAEVMAAQFELAMGNREAGIQLLKSVRRLNAHDEFTLHMLGSAYFQEGSYSLAAQTFRTGFELHRVHESRFAYNAALASDANRDAAGTMFWLKEARRSLEKQTNHTENPLWRDMVFLDGLVHVSEGLSQPDRAIARSAFQKALSSFNDFIGHRGQPTVWAEYNLACIHAELQSPYAVISEQVTKFENGLRSLPGVEQRREGYRIALRILDRNRRGDLQAASGPGESKPCPKLQNFLIDAGLYTNLYEKLRSASETRPASPLGPTDGPPVIMQIKKEEPKPGKRRLRGAQPSP